MTGDAKLRDHMLFVPRALSMMRRPYGVWSKGTNDAGRLHRTRRERLSRLELRSKLAPRAPGPLWSTWGRAA